MRAVLAIVFATSCSHVESQGPPADASATAVQLTCESGGTTFPFLEKGCTTTAECFVAVHTKNCCGTQNAVGLNKVSQAAFGQAESACDAAYPGCCCAQFPTTAEDGRTEEFGTIQVQCDIGICTTYVP
jgi:hypothetical protein